MPIRFIHTADWQLGKLYRDIPGDAGAALRVRRLDVIREIGRLATAHDADCILVAGDVFEMNTVSDETVRRALNAMESFSGPWVLIPGNHDPALAESVWTRAAKMNEASNVHLAIKPEPIWLDDLKAAVLPAPLMRRHDLADLTEWFDHCETPGDYFRIGLAHGCIENRLPSTSDAKNPIADDRAERANLDYLALGDWHGHFMVDERTHYAGTPESDRFKTNHSGHILLVDIEQPGATPAVQRLATGRFRWQQRTIALHTRDDIDALEAVLAGQEPAEDVLMQLTLSGSLSLSDMQVLERCLEQWRARFHFLGVRKDELGIAAMDEDLEALNAQGFLRDCILELQSMARDPHHAQQNQAKTALQKLFADLTSLEAS